MFHYIESDAAFGLDRELDGGERQCMYTETDEIWLHLARLVIKPLYSMLVNIGSRKLVMYVVYCIVDETLVVTPPVHTTHNAALRTRLYSAALSTTLIHYCHQSKSWSNSDSYGEIILIRYTLSLNDCLKRKVGLY